LFALAVVLFAASAQMLRAVPAPAFVRTLPNAVSLDGIEPHLPWPPVGQASVDVVGVGTIGHSGPDSPVPIASVTKVMTAYVVLHDHPLASGDGPEITVDAQDVARYQTAGAQESVLRVVDNEKLSLRQALEALLVGSANNIAAMLARWDAGTEDAFVAKMNDTAKRLGLRDTTYADSVGLDERSVSTAADQVKLATEAMKDPTFAEVVGMPSVSLPLAGTIKNFNALVGSNGVVGIKTGSSDAAGGCLVFATQTVVAKARVMVIGAILGQHDGPFLPTVLDRGRRLAISATQVVGQKLAVRKGALVGTLRTEWSASVPVAAADDVRVDGWAGLEPKATIRVRRRTPLARGERVGTLDIQGHTVDLVASRALPSASFWWRLVTLSRRPR
jgi:D-alanyl-D-alanine carboxypeptidase (penicillin-binding protein 5/6)